MDINYEYSLEQERTILQVKIQINYNHFTVYITSFRCHYSVQRNFRNIRIPPKLLFDGRMDRVIVVINTIPRLTTIFAFFFLHKKPVYQYIFMFTYLIIIIPTFSLSHTLFAHVPFYAYIISDNDKIF